MERALTGLARMATRKSVPNLSSMAQKEYPPGAANYEILDDCGRGVSATVHRALCRPLNEIVAIKRMNLESLNCGLDEIIHEAQTMKNYSHPNVLPLYCSFVAGQELWMVMPFISGGSVLHIMKYAHPEGLDEVMIATIMKDVLRALDYVHKQGGIHRDIKAGNILVDKEGRVQLGDFGVASSTQRTGSWGHDKQARMTFVGTPCWMAPEVMEQTSGYDSTADIWSLGITLLELAHGHAPFAKFPPMKVLLMTLQNPPPTLEDKGKKHFSKAMRDLVTRCLQKEARLRPSAAQLLEHKFFKLARDEKFLAEHLMAGLPPLGERVQEIRQGKAATNAQDNEANFARSQDEYMKGISSWNFDVAALKAKAAMEPDDDEPVLPTITESDETLEGTLSGLMASQAAAAFLQAQISPRRSLSNLETPTLAAPVAAAAPVNNPPVSSNGSAFACPQGQQQLLSTSSTSFMGPPAPTLTNETVPLGTTSVQPDKPASQHGAESVPLSPGNASPTGLSREGSVQGPMNSMGTTPSNKPKATKQQGRFHIYEPGSEPPPMSTGMTPGTAPASTATSVTLETTSMPISRLSQSVGLPDPGPSAAQPTVPSGRLAAALSGPGQEGQLPGPRMSEDGTRRPPPLDVQDSVVDENASVEPKKKGRFLVVEQAGMSKVQSAANLSQSESSKSRAEVPAQQATLGRPPAVPSSLSPAAAIPVTVVVPKLQELLDHATAHQAALQRLVGALMDAEKGKVHPMLNRTSFVKGSGVPEAVSTGRMPTSSGGADSEEGMSAAELRQRLAELESEVSTLRQRNAQLELLVSVNVHHSVPSPASFPAVHEAATGVARASMSLVPGTAPVPLNMVQAATEQPTQSEVGAPPAHQTAAPIPVMAAGSDLSLTDMAPLISLAGLGDIGGAQ